MSCKFDKKLISFYIDGECSGNELKHVEKHLKECENCNSILASTQEVSSLIKHGTFVELSSQYTRNFKERFEAEEQKWTLFDIAKENMKNILIPAPQLAKVAVTILLVAAVTLTFTYTSKANYPLLSYKKGGVEIYLAKRDRWIDAKEGMPLKKKDKIRTKEGSQLDIGYAKIYDLRLKENTILETQEVFHRKSVKRNILNLEKGRILVKTAPEFEGRELEITTKTASILVVGTAFVVEYKPKLEATWVVVGEGKVKVTSTTWPDIEDKKAQIFVMEGYKTEIPISGLPRSPIKLPRHEELLLEELYELGEIYPNKPTIQRSAGIPGKIYAKIIVSDNFFRAKEFLSKPRLYMHGKEESQTQRLIEEGVRIIDKAIGTRNRKLHLAGIENLRKACELNPHEEFTTQIKLFIGAYYNYLNMPNEAVQIFLETAKSGSSHSRPWKSFALYCAGSITEQKLHNHKQAEKLYKEILKRHRTSFEAKASERALRRIALR